MNCQDFETIWNELLDLESAGPSEESSLLLHNGANATDRLESLRDHARQCAVCRPIMQKYHNLRLAIRSWERASKPTLRAELTDRILAALDADPEVSSNPNTLRIKRLHRATWIVTTLAAAASIALVIIHRSGSPVANVDERSEAIARVERKATDARPLLPTPPNTLALRQALSEASEATWELAYAASAPALRIGRQVLEPAEEPPASLEGLDNLEASNSDDPGEIMSDVLNEFGQELSSGVRPLSSGARRAFDFLRGVVKPSIKGGKTSTSTSSKGA